MTRRRSSRGLMRACGVLVASGALAGCSLFGLGREDVEVTGILYLDSVPVPAHPVSLSVLTNNGEPSGGRDVLATTQTDFSGRYRLQATVDSEKCEDVIVHAAETESLGCRWFELTWTVGCGTGRNQDIHCAS